MAVSCETNNSYKEGAGNCNSIDDSSHVLIQIAHTQVQTKLLDLIYQGFLVSVMASSLSQVSFFFVKFKFEQFSLY